MKTLSKTSSKESKTPGSEFRNLEDMFLYKHELTSSRIFFSKNLSFRDKNVASKSTIFGKGLETPFFSKTSQA